MNNDRKHIELTPTPDLSQAKKIGPDRNKKPVYVDRLPPCNYACPAGENIQAWMACTQAGNFKEAWKIIMHDNPFPAVHGRVCYKPCEGSCNRKYLDKSVSIHAVERFLGDLAVTKGWKVGNCAQPIGKRILVIGAGPSGLSAAYHLARIGYEVTIHEAGPMAGGMMHFGIPQYRLPRSVLEHEIRRIEAMGVNIVLNHKVEDINYEKSAGDFEAVFVAVGAHLSKRTYIPAQDAGKVIDALNLFSDVETGQTPRLGRRVIVYGGGDSAMDAARTAKRLGAEEALIVYRRDRAHMPAHDSEVDYAIEEDVKIHWLRSIKEIDHTTFTVELMQLDDKGWPQPTGEFEILEADTLVLALGQNVDNSFLERMHGLETNEDGTVVVDHQMMTTVPGIFAGGDMVPAERSVTVATGHGKKAARCIDAWLRGQQYEKPQQCEIAHFDVLNIWYYTDAAQRRERKADMPHRKGTFDEVVTGLTEHAAVFEARRCLSCGNCFECDGCYGACPEEAIVKLGPGKRYVFDYELCTGCAECFDQCPCGAIMMVPEPG